MVSSALHLNPGASETAECSIILTGARRTGTSLLANLLYSTRETELAFEPPALRTLFPLIDQISDAQWYYMFSALVFEDFMVPALAGRRLNLNCNDDSNAYAALGEEEVAQRLSKSHRQIELAPAAAAKRAAFKLPDMIPYLAGFRRIVPNHTAIAMLRNPTSVIHSLLRMEWLTDERLSGISADWPHR